MEWEVGPILSTSVIRSLSHWRRRVGSVFGYLAPFSVAQDSGKGGRQQLNNREYFVRGFERQHETSQNRERFIPGLLTGCVSHEGEVVHYIRCPEGDAVVCFLECVSRIPRLVVCLEQ